MWLPSLGQIKLTVLLVAVASIYQFGVNVTKAKYEEKISEQAKNEAQKEKAFIEAARAIDDYYRGVVDEQAITLSTRIAELSNEKVEMAKAVAKYKAEAEAQRSAGDSTDTCLSAEWLRLVQRPLK